MQSSGLVDKVSATVSHSGPSLEELLANEKARTLRSPSGKLRHPYLVPGAYDECWDWDSYFIALALADYNEGHPHIRGTVENFFSQAAPDGSIPRWLHPEKSFRDSSFAGSSFTDDLAKPFLAQMALVYANATGDHDWFRPYLEQERAFLDLWCSRRMGVDGLHVWANGFESGGDNHPDVFGWPDFSVEGVDLAVFLVREHMAAATLAHRCGDYSAYQRFLGTGRFLLHQMMRLLYDPKNEHFFNRFRPVNQPINIHSQTRFYPFWLGDLTGLDTATRQRVLERDLWNPDTFLSPHGLRSLSKRDPIFNNTKGTAPSNWQGPIWIVGNYINFCGLLQADLRDHAVALAARLEHLLRQDLLLRGQMSECYHSETGEPLAQRGFLSWNLLVGAMPHMAQTGKLPCAILLPSE